MNSLNQFPTSQSQEFTLADIESQQNSAQPERPFIPDLPRVEAKPVAADIKSVVVPEPVTFAPTQQFISPNLAQATFDRIDPTSASNWGQVLDFLSRGLLQQ